MSRALVIIVFTDIVGSTEMRSRIGDDEADRTVARHDAVVGELFSAHGGRVVKYLGDGALATFSSAVDAIEAAAAVQAQLADTGPQIRVGIHAGDVEIADGDAAGLPVAVASRLCGVAPTGAVVASGLVRSLVGVRGGFRFESLGWPALKGVAEPVEVWRVEPGGATTTDESGQLRSPVLGRRVKQFVGREGAMSVLGETVAVAPMSLAGLSRFSFQKRHWACCSSARKRLPRCLSRSTTPDHFYREASPYGERIVPAMSGDGGSISTCLRRRRRRS